MSLFDKLLTHPVPVDRDAKRVAFDTGDHWEAKPLEVDWQTFDTPPLPRVNLKRPMPEHDLRGLKLGRMTVVSLHSNGNHRWLCKCECGQYEIRSDESLIKQIGWKKPNRPKCAVCMARGRVIHPKGLNSSHAHRIERKKRLRDRRVARIAELVAVSGKPWGAK